MLGLLRQQRTTFPGKHYTVIDAPNDPKTVQEHLPFLVGGGGEKRTMRIAAQYADEWNAWTTPEAMTHKVQVLRQHCDALGRDPAEIRVSTQALLFMSDDQSWLAEHRANPPGMPTIVGTAAEVVDIVAAYRDAGVDELIVPDWTMRSLERRMDTYDQFMTEVVPQIS